MEERGASAFITTAEIRFSARNVDEVSCDAKTAGRKGNSGRMMVCEMSRINAGLVAVHGENMHHRAGVNIFMGICVTFTSIKYRGRKMALGLVLPSP